MLSAVMEIRLLSLRGVPIVKKMKHEMLPIYEGRNYTIPLRGSSLFSQDGSSYYVVSRGPGSHC